MPLRSRNFGAEASPSAERTEDPMYAGHVFLSGSNSAFFGQARLDRA
jgi:hypothetical protein